MNARAFSVAGIVLTGTVVLCMPARAADKFHITAEERTACGQDATELCVAAYPDEDKLLACMKLNRLSLSPACRPIFEEGIRRRHLN